MADIIKSFIDASRERVKNPLIGSFLLSWLVLNWKLVFTLLFSSLEMTERIDIIQESYIGYKYNFWYPLGISASLAVLSPLLMLLFDWLTKRPQTERKKLQLKRMADETEARYGLKKAELDLDKIKVEIETFDKLTEKVNLLEEKTGAAEDLIKNLTEQKEKADELIHNQKEIIEIQEKAIAESKRPHNDKSLQNQLKEFNQIKGNRATDYHTAKKIFSSLVEPMGKDERSKFIRIIELENVLPATVPKALLERLWNHGLLDLYSIVNNENRATWCLSNPGRLYWDMWTKENTRPDPSK